MQETTVTNMPTAAVWIIAIAQIVFALSTLLIAFAAISLLGALKNAIDFLYREWNNKAAGFVGYGSAGGVRAVEVCGW